MGLAGAAQADIQGDLAPMDALDEAFPTCGDGIADRPCRYSAFRRMPGQLFEVSMK